MKDKNIVLEPANNPSFQTFLETLSILPAISPLSNKLFTIIDDPNVSISVIGGLIGEDPGLASRLMTVANSPFYPFSEKVSSIRGALVRLGLVTVRGILLTTSLFDRVKHQPGVFELWKHSLGVSRVAKTLANRTRDVMTSDEAALAGLLHDIGKLPFLIFKPQRMENIWKTGPRTGKDSDWELEEFGLSHDQLGGRLLTQWKFPEIIRDSIRWHHQPDKCPSSSRRSAALIGLSDTICRGLGIAHADFPYLDAPLGDFLDILEIPGDEIIPVIQGVISDRDMLETASREIF
ncbi:MAG: HDOD domain-containing protein [Leptospirillum sp.]|jgi:putative nucleotidyltransferase with HDIG domain